MKVPIVYQIILDWIYSESYLGRIEVHRVRKILRHRFRIPKKQLADLFKDLRERGYIKFENQMFVQIKIPCCQDRF